MQQKNYSCEVNRDLYPDVTCEWTMTKDRILVWREPCIVNCWTFAWQNYIEISTLWDIELWKKNIIYYYSCISKCCLCYLQKDIVRSVEVKWSESVCENTKLNTHSHAYRPAPTKALHDTGDPEFCFLLIGLLFCFGNWPIVSLYFINHHFLSECVVLFVLIHSLIESRGSLDQINHCLPKI